MVYGFALWTYTLLPLPETHEIECSPVQLVPGNFVHDILTYDVSGIGALLRTPALQQVVLNIALFLPAGFLLRALWNRGVVFATVTSLAVSLLIEVTQVTGIYGLYPCAYRLFDVDDLIAKTLGGLLGALAALFVPRGRARTAAAPEARVTVGRRLLGMVSDALVTVLMTAVAGIAIRAVQLYVLKVPFEQLDQAALAGVGYAVPFVIGAVVVLATGRTIGDHAVQLRYAPGPGPVYVSGAIRYLAGIGGFQLLGLLSPLDILFALVSLVLVFTTADRRGLPGIILRRPLEISREAPQASPRAGR
ncbi:VanZ family protein [Microbacterium paludicola]|uniref:VanZ family protein n=1 Tax=Microbacterium paludicola TaxID=300019 RepID=UPI0031D9D77B